MCIQSATSLVSERLRRVEIVKVRHFGLNFIISIVTVLLLVTQLLSVVLGIHLGQTV